MRVGFVLTETVEGRFVPWESFLDWESYIDLYCLALMKKGHNCTKYVPSIETDATVSYRHKFGHVVKRIPVRHPLMNPRWLSRGRLGRAGLSTTAYQLQGLGFTMHLLREAKADQVDVLHYSSYYSSFFVPSFLMRSISPLIAQYSGGSIPEGALEGIAWRGLLAPALSSASAILIGDYKSERQFLRSQAGANSSKTRNFDSPVVDTSVFRPFGREESIRKVGFEKNSTNLLSVTFIPRKHSDVLAKNPFALVSLFAETRRKWSHPLTLYFAGFGPGMDELRDHARAEGVDSQVKLLGRVEHRLLPGFYSASDIVFVPYAFEKLNEGSVTFEAFACGTPVVGWRRSAQIPSEQYGGFLVDLNPSSGSEQLVSRLGDRDYMARKREEGLNAGREVSLEVAGQKLDSIYREAVNKAHERPGLQ